tara:strand:+ start:1387 stop:2103 length:717 start_codon:yes stop_codon:yes gene_type:complete
VSSGSVTLSVVALVIQELFCMQANFSTVIDQDKVVGGEPMLSGSADQVVPDFGRQIGPPRQYPKVVMRRTRNEGVSVIVLVERKHVIATGERPEKGYRETSNGLLTLEFRCAISFFPPTLITVKAAIKDADRAVISQVIGRRHIGQATLEAMVETHDLVPNALVAVDIERTDGFNTIRTASTPHQQNKSRNQSDQAVAFHYPNVHQSALIASSSEKNNHSPLVFPHGIGQRFMLGKRG